MNRLTKKDRQILTMLADGMSDGDVNRRLGINSADLHHSLDRMAQWAANYEIPYETLVLYERALRTRAESALRSVRGRFEALLDGMPNAVLVIDGRTGLIGRANAKAAELFGYDVAELVGRSVEDLVPEQHRTIHPAYRMGFLMSVRKREMGYHPPIYGLRSDGEKIEMAISLTASTADDDVMVVCTEYEAWARTAQLETADRATSG